MRLWAEIFDANNNRIADAGGPINLRSAQINRPLDGVGTISCSTVITDKRALDHLTNERRIRVFTMSRDESQKRELARCIIQNVTQSVNDGALELFIDAPDAMDELRRRSTLLFRSFENQPVSTIMDVLAALVPNIRIETQEDAGMATARFHGNKVLRAVLKIVEQLGLHIRLNGDVVEVGAFGQDSGIRIIGGFDQSAAISESGTIYILERPELVRRSEELFNWIIPLGAGDGKAQLTLKDSTRSTANGDPFDIETISNPDGSTLYFIKSDVSIAQFGQIEGHVIAKEIAPISNGATATQAAANALYDAAAAKLQRMDDIQFVYRIALQSPPDNILPGDKVRVRYKGSVVDVDNNIVEYIDINTDLWVLTVNESLSDSGHQVTLDVSNIDLALTTDDTVIVGALEDAEVVKTSTQIFPAPFYWESKDFFIRRAAGAAEPDKKAKFPLRLAEFVLDVIKVEIGFETDPLSTFAVPIFATSGLFYQVIVGSLFPTKVRLFVNGNDVSSQLGGPWNNGNENVKITALNLDITSILESAPGGIHQDHLIEIQSDRPGTTRNWQVPGFGGSTLLDDNKGWVNMSFTILATGQAIFPV